MMFGRKNTPPGKEDAPPPLPQAVRDFMRAIAPDDVAELSPLTSRTGSRPATADDQTPSALPVCGGGHGIDRIVEIRIRQWMEEIKIAENAAKKPASSGRALNFFPPHR